MNKIRKAIIPAAGFGTRFLPVTKGVPKEMIPIIDIPTIEYIIREAFDSGIKDFLLIINNDKDTIKKYFGHNVLLEEFLLKKNKINELNLVNDLSSKVSISYVVQEEQLGLGHAVLQAKDFVGNEPFALLLGDDVYVGREEPATLQLIRAFEQTNSSILGTLYVPDCDVSKYGICSLKESNNKAKLLELDGVIEKPALCDAPSNLAIGGRYILTPRIFDYLENQTPGAGGEIQLTDSILRMMNEEKVYSLQIDGRRYDIGSKKGYVKATIDFALSREDLHDEILNFIKSKI